MKTNSHFGLTILFALALAPTVAAQTEATEGQPASPSNSVRAGTEMKARLESTLDAQTAKPGDEVAARVTEDVKQDGKTVIRKGDRLLGRVAPAEAAGNANSSSSSNSTLAVDFDRLVQGKTTAALHTVVSAVVSTPAEQRAVFDRAASEPAIAPPPPSRSGGGGLLGGVTSTAGSAVGATVGATGSALGGVGGTLDATAQNAAGSATGISLATPARAIQLGSEGQTSQNGTLTSVLRTDQGRLRLESGTMLEFRVSSETEAAQKTE